jgi:hypothetical protein
MTELDLLVESTVTSFHLDWADREIRIDVRSPWGDKRGLSIIATGIDDCHVADLRLYNIIDRVSVYGCDEAQQSGSQCAPLLFLLMRNTEPTGNDLEWPPFREKLLLIAQGKLKLLTIDSVIGATALVLAEQVMIQSAFD